jgi:hypothetical protein
MNLEELGWEGADWKEMAQDRNQCRHILNTIMNLPLRDCWLLMMDKQHLVKIILTPYRANWLKR